MSIRIHERAGQRQRKSLETEKWIANCAREVEKLVTGTKAKY